MKKLSIVCMTLAVSVFFFSCNDQEDIVFNETQNVSSDDFLKSSESGYNYSYNEETTPGEIAAFFDSLESGAEMEAMELDKALLFTESILNHTFLLEEEVNEIESELIFAELTFEVFSGEGEQFMMEGNEIRRINEELFNSISESLDAYEFEDNSLARKVDVVDIDWSNIVSGSNTLQIVYTVSNFTTQGLKSSIFYYSPKNRLPINCLNSKPAIPLLNDFIKREAAVYCRSEYVLFGIQSTSLNYNNYSALYEDTTAANPFLCYGVTYWSSEARDVVQSFRISNSGSSIKRVHINHQSASLGTTDRHWYNYTYFHGTCTPPVSSALN